MPLAQPKEGVDQDVIAGLQGKPLIAGTSGWSPVWLVIGFGAVIGGLYLAVPWDNLLVWAAQEQRAFQTAMAGSLRAIRGGDGLAIFTLCSATAAYGFVHALGPGHGKVLLGGAAIATGVTLRRMAGLTLLSSLAQAASAILLVGGAAFVFGWATRDLVGLTEVWLAPASAVAIAGIGVLLIVRGVRAWPRPAPIETPQGHGTCGCGHDHGPSVAEVRSLGSRREAVASIASIAMRPCTGALIVLVISASMGIFWIGCLAVVTMGLGTATLNLLVAATGVTSRRFIAGPLGGVAMRQVSAGLHILGGALIALASLTLLRTYTSAPFVLP